MRVAADQGSSGPRRCSPPFLGLASPGPPPRRRRAHALPVSSRLPTPRPRGLTSGGPHPRPRPPRTARLGVQPAPPRAAAPAPQLKAGLGLLRLRFVVRPLPFPSWGVWPTWITGLTGDLSEKVAATVLRRRLGARLGGPGSAAPTPAAAPWGVLGREEVAGDVVSSVSDPGGDFSPSVKPGHLPAALSGVRGGHVLHKPIDL